MYTYEEFKSWIIAIIAGVLGGVLFLVIGVIVFIKLRARFASEAAAKNEGKQEETKTKKYPRNKK